MAQYTRFRKRAFANINKEPQDNMERISARLQGTKQQPGATLQLKGMMQRESYMKQQRAQQVSESNKFGFGVIPSQGGTYNPNSQPNTMLERMYRDRTSRFGRQVRKGRFGASGESTQQQIKYTQGTNRIVMKQAEMGEITPDKATNRYSFSPNYYSMQRARDKSRGGR
jgi:hypothetical protein